MTKGLSKLICLLVGLAVLSFGSLAFAQPPSDAPPPPDCKDMQKPPPHLERHLKESLQKLVQDGTITEQQSDKVFAFIQREHQKDFEKIKAMSPEERDAFLAQKKDHKPDIIGDLIKNADLSESQAKKVAEAIRPPAPPSSSPQGQ